MRFERAPKVRAGKDMPWGSTPPEGAILQGVSMTILLSGRGYTGVATARWIQPLSRTGFWRQDTAMTQETTFRQDWPFAPSLGAVLRAHSRYAWDMSISPLVQEMEGQEALPGL